MTFQQIERQRESFRRKWEREFRDTLEDQFTIYMDVWRSTGNKRAARQAVEEPEPMRESYRKFYRAVGTYFAIKQYADLQKLKDAPPRDYWTDKIDDYVRRTGKTKAQAINAYSAELLGAMTSEVSLEVLDNVEYEKLGNDWRNIVITRSERIFQTEVVCASELGKVEAAKYVRDEEGLPTMKRWQANLDAGVREAHYYADGKEAELDEYFTVGGEQLRFPGDTSGGATAKNLINCRCANEYFKGDGVPKPPDAEPEPTSTEDLQREQENQPDIFKPASDIDEAKSRYKNKIQSLDLADRDARRQGFVHITDSDKLDIDDWNVILESIENTKGARSNFYGYYISPRGSKTGALATAYKFYSGGYIVIHPNTLKSAARMIKGHNSFMDLMRTRMKQAVKMVGGADRIEEVVKKYRTTHKGDFTTLNRFKNWADKQTFSFGKLQFGDSQAVWIHENARLTNGHNVFVRSEMTNRNILRSVLHHEMGHIYDFGSGIRLQNIDRKMKSLGTLLKRRMKDRGIPNTWINSDLSEYALTDDLETWAEATALYFDGNMGGVLLDEYEKILNEIVR